MQPTRKEPDLLQEGYHDPGVFTPPPVVDNPFLSNSSAPEGVDERRYSFKKALVNEKEGE